MKYSPIRLGLFAGEAVECRQRSPSMFRFSLCLGALFFLADVGKCEEKQPAVAPVGTWTLRTEDGGHSIVLTISERGSLTWKADTVGKGSGEITAADFAVSDDNLLYGFMSSVLRNNKEKPLEGRLIPFCFRFKLDGEYLRVVEVKGPFDEDAEKVLCGRYERSRYTR